MIRGRDWTGSKPISGDIIKLHQTAAGSHLKLRGQKKILELVTVKGKKDAGQVDQTHSYPLVN